MIIAMETIIIIGLSQSMPTGEMQKTLEEKLRRVSVLKDVLRSLNNRYCVVASTGSSEDLKIHSNVILNMVQVRIFSLIHLH